jgi:hypothetical protein
MVQTRFATLLRCTLHLCALVSTVAISADMGEGEKACDSDATKPATIVTLNTHASSVAENEIGADCRCHKTTLKCEEATWSNFFSWEWTSDGVDSGLCDAEFLAKQHAFEDALVNAGQHREYSQWMEKDMDKLTVAKKSFEDDIRARSVSNKQGYALGGEEKNKDKYKDLKTGTKAFLAIGLKLNRATELLAAGKDFSEAFQRKTEATDGLHDAIKGISLSKLEQAMEQGNRHNVEMEVLYQAEARKNELQVLSSNVQKLVPETRKGQDNLQAAVDRIEAVKEHMTKVAEIQHDLGPDAMQILQRWNAHNNVNVIIERLEQMKASLKLDDSKKQMDKLSSVLTDLVSEIGTA